MRGTALKNTAVLENFPVEIFNLINRYLGITIEVHAGKITGAFIEGNEFRQSRKVSLERLIGLLSRYGVVFGSGPDAGGYIMSAKGDDK